jgi:hypothetical protein
LGIGLWPVRIVPGEGIGPNVDRLGLSGWLLREEGEEKSRKLKAAHNHGRPVNAGSSRFKFLASFADEPWFTYSNGCQKVEGRETSLRPLYR